MIDHNSEGIYFQKDTMISTGDEVDSIEVANFQLETIELAKNAIANIRSSQRNISTLTFSISEDGYKKIVDIIRSTRKEISKVAHSDKDEDRVCQLNIQLFPLTKT